MRHAKLVYIFSILIIESLGFAAGMLTRTGTKIYAESIHKPPLSPPGIVFPIAWTILYALMGIGIARILLCDSSSMRTIAIVLFVSQLILNLAWCFIFFGKQDFVLAFIELLGMLVLVVLMTVDFRKLDTMAAALQIPYILWLCFAAYLNFGVIILN